MPTKSDSAPSSGATFNEAPSPLADGNAPVEPKVLEPRVRTIAVRLLYDTWLEEDVRTVAGTVVDVDIEDAKRMIKDKKAERADPMPGE